jgi:glycosyltransferase 2 family protein
MRANYRKLIIGFVIVVGLGALAYHSRHKIHLADFTWKKFMHSVSLANIPLLLLAIVLIYACYGIRALRWQRFSRYIGACSFWDTYSATLMGFASIFLFARVGEPVRPLLLAQKSNTPVAGMFGIWVLERAFDFAAALLLFSISLLIFPRSLFDAGASGEWVDKARTGGWLLVVLLGGLTFGLAYFRLHGAGSLHRRLEGWRASRGWRKAVAAAIGGFSEGLQAIRTIPDLLMAIFYSAAHWGLVVLIYMMVIRAFGDAFPFVMNYPGAMLLLAVTLVGSTLQLPGVGGGAQFASIIALTTIFGVDQEPATAAAIALWLITFCSCILLGIPLLIHQGFNVGKLWQLARAEAKAEDVGTHIPAQAVPTPQPHHPKVEKDSKK